MSIPYKTMRCTVIYPLRNMFEVAPLEAPGGLNQGRAIKVDLGNLGIVWVHSCSSKVRSRSIVGTEPTGVGAWIRTCTASAQFGVSGIELQR